MGMKPWKFSYNNLGQQNEIIQCFSYDMGMRPYKFSYDMGMRLYKFSYDKGMRLYKFSYDMNEEVILVEHALVNILPALE